jgi:hypothetical protein
MVENRLQRQNGNKEELYLLSLRMLEGCLDENSSFELNLVEFVHHSNLVRSYEQSFGQ